MASELEWNVAIYIAKGVVIWQSRDDNKDRILKGKKFRPFGNGKHSIKIEETVYQNGRACKTLHAEDSHLAE